MQPLEEIRKAYRVEALLEQMPTVDRYVAYDLSSHQSVTLHILRNVSAVLRQRVTRAVEIAQTINHPHFLGVIKAGPLDNGKRLFWTTPVYHQFATASGDPPAQVNNPKDVVRILQTIFQVLAITHTAGLIHNRIRWAALVTVGENLCLSDFGVPEFASIQEERGKKGDYENLPKGDIIDAIRMASMATTVRHINARTHADPEWEKLRTLLAGLEQAVLAGAIKTAGDAERRLCMSCEGEQSISLRTINAQRSAVEQTAIKAICTQLPVVARVLERIGVSKRLHNVVVLHVNHCLDDVFILDRLFGNLFHRSIYVAIPYGRQRIPDNHEGTIFHAMLRTNSFDLLRSGEPIGERTGSFAEAMNRMVSRALRDVIFPLLREGRKLLIVEDGGYHYKPLQDCFVEGIISSEDIIGAVEQTMSGALKCAAAIKSHGIHYPALTLARSDLKMRFEAFFVGRRIVDELNYLLYRYDTFLSLRRVLVLGYGIIGRSVALSLEGLMCDVAVYDIDEEVQAVGKNDGFTVIKCFSEELFDSELVVVGATGEAAFSLEMLIAFLHSKSNRLFLVSASSKRIEFASIIEFFESESSGIPSYEHPQLTEMQDVSIQNHPCGITYRCKWKGREKTIVLVARGFPVNFFREDGFSLTMGMIDPVNAELVLLANTAVEAKSVLIPNKLYALGYSRIPRLGFSEEELIGCWSNAAGITPRPRMPSSWHGFPIHPAEDLLRLNRFDRLTLAT